MERRRWPRTRLIGRWNRRTNSTNSDRGHATNGDKTYQPTTRRWPTETSITNHYQRNSTSKVHLRQLYAKIEVSENCLFIIKYRDQDGAKYDWYVVAIDLDETDADLAKRKGQYHWLFYFAQNAATTHSPYQLRILATHQRIHWGRNLRTDCAHPTTQGIRDTRQKSDETRMVSTRNQHHRRWSLRPLQFWDEIHGTQTSMGSSDPKRRKNWDRHIQHHRQTSTESTIGSNLPENSSIKLAATQQAHP